MHISPYKPKTIKHITSQHHHKSKTINYITSQHHHKSKTIKHITSQHHCNNPLTIVSVDQTPHPLIIKLKHQQLD